MNHCCLSFLWQVPQANVNAKIEDYDKDREEEEKRAQDMMSEIGDSEKESSSAGTHSFICCFLSVRLED